MQRFEVSGAVRFIYKSLGVKGLYDYRRIANQSPGYTITSPFSLLRTFLLFMLKSGAIYIVQSVLFNQSH